MILGLFLWNSTPQVVSLDICFSPQQTPGLYFQAEVLYSAVLSLTQVYVLFVALLCLPLFRSSLWCASASTRETIQQTGSENRWSHKTNSLGAFLAVTSVQLTERLTRALKANLKCASFKSLTYFVALGLTFFKIHWILEFRKPWNRRWRHAKDNQFHFFHAA